MSAQEAQQAAEAKLDAIIAEVRRLAAEKPDYVYEQPERASLDGEFYGVESVFDLNTCLYVHKPADSAEATPGCLFGHAFLNLGYTVDQVKRCDRDLDASEAIRTLVGDGDLGTSEEIERKLSWANSAQSGQDGGATWEGAVAHADEFWGEVRA